MNDRQTVSAMALLESAAAELSQIDAPESLQTWRKVAARKLRDALVEVEPFRDYNNVWIHSGDGSGGSAEARFGEWAIDLLVEKMTPKAILAAFSKEIERSAATYCDVSPVFGVRIDALCDLGGGGTLVPASHDELASMLQASTFDIVLPRDGVSLLSQSFTVKPAFERRTTNSMGHYDTSPKSDDRELFRRRVRLTCLLASSGPVELPLTLRRADSKGLFIASDGYGGVQTLFAAHPLGSYPVESAKVKHAYALLGKFHKVEVITRAIERLGRPRMANSQVDRALDLGIAAEIVLMHDAAPDNTEITQKISSRAAWLLGETVDERKSIFNTMKNLYSARSSAVHKGYLKSNVDFNEADNLVARVILAILEDASFPDWNNLTMGAHRQKDADCLPPG